MATDRETAKRQRAEARKQRRKQSNESAGDDVPEAETPDEQPFESLKQAAKAAAATAALGAAVAAARALSNRNGSEGDDEVRRQSDDEPEGEAQADDDAPQQQYEDDTPQQQDDAPRQQDENQEARMEEEPPGKTWSAGEPQRHAPQRVREGEAWDVAVEACRHLQAVLGKPAEEVSALETTGDGWLVTIEVVETRRIPETTDVLASYEVELDEDHQFRRYARVRRYVRAEADRDGIS